MFITAHYHNNENAKSSYADDLHLDSPKCSWEKEPDPSAHTQIRRLIGYTQCLDLSQHSGEILTHYAEDMLAGKMLKLKPKLRGHQRI